MSQIMPLHYSQSQDLLQPSSNRAECSHTFKHDPSPFLLAAHHVVKRPVSAHLSRTVGSSSKRVGLGEEEDLEEEGDEDRYYSSHTSPKLKPKPKAHGLASFSSAESLPSSLPSESSIISSLSSLSSSSSSSPPPSPSQAETRPSSLSNDAQGRLSLGGFSPPRGSAKAKLHPYQSYAANVHSPQQQQHEQQHQQRHQHQQQQQQQQQHQHQQHQQQQQQRQQQPRRQRQEATSFEGKLSGDYDDTPSQGSPSRGTVYTYTSDEMLGDGRSSLNSPTQHTMWILIYLSFLSPFLTLPIALYTLLITPVLILLSPLSLLTTSCPSLHIQLHRFLSPPINAQLDFILSSTTPRHRSSTSDHDDNYDDDEIRANPVMLVLVSILSPIYAIGICLSAWVAALFWFYAAILGDPDTGYRDGRDDGRAAVLGVRRWWERWLEQAR